MSDGKLNLGVSLHCLANPCPAEDVKRLADSKVQTLEITPKLFEGDGGLELRAELDKLFATSHVRAGSVHALFGGPDDISVLDEPARTSAVAETLNAVQLAGELDADFVIVHASAEPIEDSERAARIAQCRKSLAELTDAAQKASTRITVELLPRTCLGNTVEELVALLGGLDGEAFGVCLDANHEMDRWRELPAYVKALGDKLWTLHISDYDGVDEKHWMPGKGVVDWGAFARALRGIDFRGPFNYEGRPDGETLAERLAALEANFEWVCAQV